LSPTISRPLKHTTCPRWRQRRISASPRMDRRSSWAKVFSKPAVSRNFNEPLSTLNAAARSHKPSLMKLRIPTRRHPPDEEEEHAEQQVRAVRRRAQVEVEVEVEERRVAPVQ